MSLKQCVSEVEKVSYNIEKILEKADSSKERIELFSTYYKMLILLQDSIINITYPEKKRI